PSRAARGRLARGRPAREPGPRAAGLPARARAADLPPGTGPSRGAPAHRTVRRDARDARGGRFSHGPAPGTRRGAAAPRIAAGPAPAGPDGRAPARPVADARLPGPGDPLG